MEQSGLSPCASHTLAEGTLHAPRAGLWMHGSPSMGCVVPSLSEGVASERPRGEDHRWGRRRPFCPTGCPMVLSAGFGAGEVGAAAMPPAASAEPSIFPGWRRVSPASAGNRLPRHPQVPSAGQALASPDLRPCTLHLTLPYHWDTVLKPSITNFCRMEHPRRGAPCGRPYRPLGGALIGRPKQNRHPRPL